MREPQKSYRGAARVWLALVTAAALVGCGSGALNPPDSSSHPTDGSGSSASEGSSSPGAESSGKSGPSTSGGGDPNAGGGGTGGTKNGGGGGSGGKNDGDRYRWDLPPGDISPTGNEGSFYGVLLRCTGAQEELEDEGWWQGFSGPRNVLLYMAAAHLCHGDNAGGRPYYERALALYGRDGLGRDSRPCDVYRSVSSVLRQMPRGDVTCPDGESQGFQYTADGRVDNPLTFDVDESRVSEATTEQPSQQPSEEPAGPPTGDPTDDASQQPSAETSDDGSG